MKKRLLLGTRGSALALTQSGQVAAQLQSLHPELEVVLEVIKTRGDLNQRDPLSQMGGKGVFVKELEQALLEGSIDFAVHSLKDMPARLPPGLALAPPPSRADPRDALVGSAPLLDLPAGARIGTGSLRRQVQLRALRPDLEFGDIRGNVPTRVEKWRSGEYPGGVVLACAGLERLAAQSGALASEIFAFSVQDCVPSPCQGILGVQYRLQDLEVGQLLAALGDPETTLAMEAERAFLEALGGDCNLPAGGFARIQGEQIRFVGVLWRERLVRVEMEGPGAQACELGRKAAEQLLAP